MFSQCGEKCRCKFVRVYKMFAPSYLLNYFTLLRYANCNYNYTLFYKNSELCSKARNFRFKIKSASNIHCIFIFFFSKIDLFQSKGAVATNLTWESTNHVMLVSWYCHRIFLIKNLVFVYVWRLLNDQQTINDQTANEKQQRQRTTYSRSWFELQLCLWVCNVWVCEWVCVFLDESLSCSGYSGPALGPLEALGVYPEHYN